MLDKKTITRLVYLMTIAYSGTGYAATLSKTPTQWSTTAVYATAGSLVTYNGVEYTNNWWTQGDNPAQKSGCSGSGQPWTPVGKCGVTPTPTPSPTPTVNPTPTPTPSPTPSPLPGAVATSGSVYFHSYVPQTSASSFSDSMTLTGDNYTDLIMSNYIAGVMLGHNINKAYPGIQFNKDYMYGTIWGQLLQENLQTQLYQASLNTIAPSPLQTSVMGVGQGGPYQINSYFFDMVNGSYTPGGHSLVNFVALQKNIGYTIATQAAQISATTPSIFNNKYYSPMLTSYFHFNDLVALQALEDGSQGYISSAAPNYPKCMVNLKSMANSPLDILVNYAYNQGFFGGLVATMANDCINMSSAAFLSKYNDYSNAGNNSPTGANSYKQYPYQVRFYLDELYNQSSLNTTLHVAFNMTQLASVFSNVFQTLAYTNAAGSYNYISATQANTAFNAALATANVSSAATLDLSVATQRKTIYTILETAINNLEANLNTNFAAISLTQIGENPGGGGGGTPSCPTSPTSYPNAIGNYTGGTIVKASDGKLYQCISNQVTAWCNQNNWAYAPATGLYWSQAWSLYTCK